MGLYSYFLLLPEPEILQLDFLSYLALLFQSHRVLLLKVVELLRMGVPDGLHFLLLFLGLPDSPDLLIDAVLESVNFLHSGLQVHV